MRVPHGTAAGTQNGYQLQESVCLHLCKAFLLRGASVCGAKVGENACKAQVGQAIDAPERGNLLHGNPNPVHSRVNRHMNGYAPALCGELAGVRFVHHRLRQTPADEQIRLLGRGVAENQDSSPDSGTPQGDALLQRGDGKRSHAAAAQSAGTGDGSVPISVRLDHCHQRTVCSRFSLEQEGVGAQSAQIDFTPRAAGFRGAAGQEKDGAQRNRRTEQQHGKKMSQTVPHQNGFQTQHFRGSAHQYNAPGVHHIKHGGETAGVPILSAV